MYNLDNIKNIFKNDLKSYNDAIILLKNELIQTIVNLNEDIKNDTTNIPKTLHKFKGTCSAINASDIIYMIDVLSNSNIIDLEQVNKIIEKIHFILEDIDKNTNTK